MFQFHNHIISIVESKTEISSVNIAYIRVNDISAIDEYDLNLTRITLVNNLEYFINTVDFDKLLCIMRQYTTFHFIKPTEPIDTIGPDKSSEIK
jgi:hypothetical protein